MGHPAFQHADKHQKGRKNRSLEETDLWGP